MKKRLILPCMLCLAITSCSKKDSNNNANPATVAFAGNWTVANYDNAPVAAPEAAVFNATITSSTAGTAHFDITFDGSAHSTEDDSYTLSGSNTGVTFTKTAGTFSVLNGGGNWAIDTLTASTGNDQPVWV